MHSSSNTLEEMCDHPTPKRSRSFQHNWNFLDPALSFVVRDGKVSHRSGTGAPSRRCPHMRASSKSLKGETRRALFILDQ